MHHRAQNKNIILPSAILCHCHLSFHQLGQFRYEYKNGAQLIRVPQGVQFAGALKTGPMSYVQILVHGR